MVRRLEHVSYRNVLHIVSEVTEAADRGLCVCFKCGGTARPSLLDLYAHYAHEKCAHCFGLPRNEEIEIKEDDQFVPDGWLRLESKRGEAVLVHKQAIRALCDFGENETRIFLPMVSYPIFVKGRAEEIVRKL